MIKAISIIYIYYFRGIDQSLTALKGNNIGYFIGE